MIEIHRIQGKFRNTCASCRNKAQFSVKFEIAGTNQGTVLALCEGCSRSLSTGLQSRLEGHSVHVSDYIGHGDAQMWQWWCKCGSRKSGYLNKKQCKDEAFQHIFQSSVNT